MKRNMFGDPQPATAAEIIAALDEIDLTAAFAQAEIFDARDQEAPFTGWCAEISDMDTGENRICTLGFGSQAELEAALSDAGIDLIVEH